MDLEGKSDSFFNKTERKLRSFLGDQGYVSLVYALANLSTPSVSREEVEQELLYKKV